MPRVAVSNRQALNLKQNFFRDSQDFSTARWTREKVTHSTASIVGPNGDMITAGIITEDNTSGNHSIYPAAANIISMVQGLFWTFSAYMKAKERTYGAISIDMGSGNNITIVNLVNGTVSSTTDSPTSSNISRSVIAKQNGWYHVIMTMYQKTTVGVLPRTGISPNGSAIVYAGDNASGIYIWQAQFVRANWEGDLTVTGASPVTTAIRNKALNRAAVSNRIAII